MVDNKQDRCITVWDILFVINLKILIIEAMKILYTNVLCNVF